MFKVKKNKSSFTTSIFPDGRPFRPSCTLRFTRRAYMIPACFATSILLLIVHFGANRKYVSGMGSGEIALIRLAEP